MLKNKANYAAFDSINESTLVPDDFDSRIDE